MFFSPFFILFVPDNYFISGKLGSEHVGKRQQFRNWVNMRKNCYVLCCCADPCIIIAEP